MMHTLYSYTSCAISLDFPRTAEGRVYHLGLKRGELAPRIVRHIPERWLRECAIFNRLINILMWIGNRWGHISGPQTGRAFRGQQRDRQS